MKKIALLLLLSTIFCAELPIVSHEFADKKIISATFLDDNFNSYNSSISDGTNKLNVGEIQINGSTLSTNIEFATLNINELIASDLVATTISSDSIEGITFNATNTYCNYAEVITIDFYNSELSPTLNIGSLSGNNAEIETLESSLLSTNIISNNSSFDFNFTLLSNAFSERKSYPYNTSITADNAQLIFVYGYTGLPAYVYINGDLIMTAENRQWFYIPIPKGYNYNIVQATVGDTWYYFDVLAGN